MRRLWVVAAALLATPALAGDPLPGQPNIVVGEFNSAPTAVVVDVVDITTPSTPSQVGNNLATNQMQRDGVDSVSHLFDVSTVTGYPTDCTPKTYHVTFIPDAANCAEGVNPELCATAVIQVGGDACAKIGVSDDFEFTNVLIAAQGITQAVLDFYNARGIQPVKWRKLLISGDADFTTPEMTAWEVYFYKDTGSAPAVDCTITVYSDPAVSLPSKAHCTP